MLKQRILTALVLILPLVAAVFYLSPVWVAVVLGLFVTAAAWEWTALAGLTRLWYRGVYTGGLVLTGGAGVLWVSWQPSIILPLLIIAVVWWLWALIELVLRSNVHNSVFFSSSGKITSGFFILIPAWMAALFLHSEDPSSPAALLFILVLVWVADAAAYFTGHAYGKMKLAPNVSPGKTVEGLLGGLLAAVLLALIYGVIVWGLKASELVLWAALAVVVTLFSVVGDLVESKFKRIAGMKDSGHLLPGHGGMLDRIDAFTGAVPVFVLGWMYLLKQ
ncbi:MAG: phosphatidate cytidylyltransferase [Gammaproteobacteria bacterium]|nr:MAG: phosphatidate cytidylyltransferase [Gammaproteobacteria bacterium]